MDVLCKNGPEGEQAFAEMHKAMKQALPDYETFNINGLDPRHCGYPVGKMRLFVCGSRSDTMSHDKLKSNMMTLLENPLPITHNYVSMLGLERFKTLNWERLHCYPTPEEFEILFWSECVCGLDPMVFCPVHKCLCDQCTKCSRRQVCAWRQHAQDYIKLKLKRDEFHDHEKAKITYIQALELQGQEAPQSARERNLLNLISLEPKLHPFQQTWGVIDLSQRINQSSLKTDGSVQTGATNTVYFMFNIGKQIPVRLMAELMGHDMRKRDALEAVSGSKAREFLGNAFHVATMGMILIGILSSVFPPP